MIFLLDSQTRKENTDLLCFVLKDAEKRKGTSSSQGQADKWERFKRRNRRRARIFHRREKGGALATLSNCIPTFVEGEGWGGQRSGEHETRHERDGKPGKLRNLLSGLVKISRKSQPNFPKKLYFYNSIKEQKRLVRLTRNAP